jgi:hypothetical protein
VILSAGHSYICAPRLVNVASPDEPGILTSSLTKTRLLFFGRQLPFPGCDGQKLATITQIQSQYDSNPSRVCRTTTRPIGHNLNQVTKGLAKTIRAMADGTLDSQVGARLCSGLGIMRACLETQKLEQLEARMGEISRLLGARTVVSSPLSIDHKTPLSTNHETNGSSH